MNLENNLSTEEKIEKLLINGLLLCELRGHKNKEDKLRYLEKHIKNGADVNAPDANDSNNTPLHIAVEKDEPEVVEFLLLMGATLAMNNNKHTPKDLATLSNSINKSKILNNLEKRAEFIQDYKKESTQIKDVGETIENKLSVEKVKFDNKTALTNESRPGTSGISGQLYETKLIGLLLHRALNDHDIDNFYIGTNILEIGAFDDIVFKYHLKNDTCPKTIFIQAKHKENPTKDKLTVDSVLKTNGDFSIDKYFESYLDIRKKIRHNKCKNVMFQNDFNDSDCSFIIYTPTIENFNKKQPVEFENKDNLISTGNKGKTFKYDYDDEDIEVMLKNVLILRTKSLAKALAENIARRKYKNMMLDEFIKTYHVFLAKNVVQIKNESKDYLMGSFRKSFLESRNEMFLLIKETMFKKLKLHDKLSTNSNDIALEFKLPKGFGNFGVINEDQIVDLCKVVEKLIKLGNRSHDIITIVVNDAMVGPKKVIQKNDLTMLGNIVGEALILDDATGLFKFNTEESSEITKRLLERLKLDGTDFIKLRLDITVQNFPQLSLTVGKPIKQMLFDFLNKLKFYTNQEDEEGVENILKYEINNRYITENEKRDSLYLIKGDAIYSQYHDKIQKWWKHPVEYLSRSCKFYDEAKKVILDSPLLNIYSEVYIKKMNDYKLNFDQKVVNALGLQQFMSNSNANILNIITKERTLTSIKVIQYFRDTKVPTNYKFIDLDVITAESNELILSDISEIMIDVIIIVLNVTGNFTNLHNVHKVTNKVIVISHSYLSEFEPSIECSKQIDKNNSITDLNIQTKRRIYEQKKILFQGAEVPFDSIVDENMQNVVKEDLLLKVISNDMIEIGREPTDMKAYYENKQFYIHRKLCRCLQLDEKCQKDFKVIEILDGKEKNELTRLEKSEDIIIISNDDGAYEAACKEHININIHWFCKNDKSQFLWKKSFGSIKNIIPYVKRVKCEKQTCLVEPKSLKHLNDRVTVISAAPGMGKSTVLTHLLVQTKQLYKSMCIIKLNLLDLKHEFSTWTTCEAGMRLRWFLLILYKSFSAYDTSFLNSKHIAPKEKAGKVYFTFNDLTNKLNLDSGEVITNAHNIALFELQTFINMYNSDNISLILDGFDEICPNYKNEAIELFKLLITSRIQYLWITSRSYINLKELECELNTFSITLKGFTFIEQIQFLVRKWGLQLQLDSNNKMHYDCVWRFLTVISNKINDYKGDFTGIPLHLWMIAETYQDYFLKDYLLRIIASSLESSGPTHHNDDEYNLITLYEKFIEIKFQKIRFGEKKNNCLCSNDPDNKMMIDRERKSFMKTFKLLAAYALLGDSNGGILTEDDVKRAIDLIQNFNSSYERTGIIITIERNELKFVHFTYVEYFACEFVCDKLKQNIESAWNYLIYDILVSYNGNNIRAFIDAKLKNDHKLSSFSLKCICDTLLKQINSNKSALHTAIYENLYNIAIFLLNNIDKYINKDNLDEFIDLISNKYRISAFLLCTDNPDKPKMDVMAKIINIIKRFDCNKLVKLFFYKDVAIYNIFSLAFLERHGLAIEEVCDDLKQNMFIILEHTNSEDMTKLLTTPLMGECSVTILHILAQRNLNMNMLKYVERLNQEQRMKVFCARDFNNKTPAHYAAQMNNYEFFEKMSVLLTSEQFKTICSLQDPEGIIPLLDFSVIETLDLVKFNLLCAKAGLKIDTKLGENGIGYTTLYDKDDPNVPYFVYKRQLMQVIGYGVQPYYLFEKQ